MLLTLGSAFHRQVHAVEASSAPVPMASGEGLSTVSLVGWSFVQSSLEGGWQAEGSSLQPSSTGDRGRGYKRRHFSFTSLPLPVRL